MYLCVSQADVCVRELVRALAKVVLLYAPLMGNAPPPSAAPPNGQGAPGPSTEPLVVGSTWGPAWRAILDCMVQGITYVSAAEATCSSSSSFRYSGCSFHTP